MNNETSEVLYQNNDVGYKPVFVLIGSQTQYGFDTKRTTKCFCAECQKLSDIKPITSIDLKQSIDAIKSNRNKISSESAGTLRNIIHETECPECHNKALVEFISPVADKNDPGTYTWSIPKYAQSVTLSKKSKDGITSEIDTELKVESGYIKSENGNMEICLDEDIATEIINLQNRSHKIINRKISNKTSDHPTKSIADVTHAMDCFRYRQSTPNRPFGKSERCAAEAYNQLNRLNNDRMIPIFAFGGYFGQQYSDNPTEKTFSLNDPSYEVESKSESHSYYSWRDNNPADRIVFKKPAVNSPIASKINPVSMSLRKDHVMKSIGGADGRDNAFANEMKKLNDIKHNAIMERVAAPGVLSDSICKQNLPVYTDFAKNHLCIKEHKIKSDETNTSLDPILTIRHANLIIRYPAAFELACKMADTAIENKIYESIRKKDPDALKNMTPEEKAAEITRRLTPVEKTITTEDQHGVKHTETVIDSPFPRSLKASIFRDQVEFIETQLAVVDDNILDTIGESKNMDEMMDYLRFYISGPETPETKKFFGGESKMPPLVKSHIMHNSVDPETGNLPEVIEPINRSIANTKNIRSKFNANPIGTANTVFQYIKIAPLSKDSTSAEIDTCTKAVANMLDYAEKDSSRIACGYISGKLSKNASDSSRDKNLVEANTVVPVRNGAFLSFLKAYTSSRTMTNVVDQLYKPNEHIATGVLNDTIRMYEEFYQKSDLNLLKDKESVARDVNVTNKQMLRSYLEAGNKIQDAYIDFIFINGDDMESPKAEKATHKVKDYIDSLAREIIEDSENNEIANYYVEHGSAGIVEAIKSGEDPKFAKYGSKLKKLDYYKEMMDSAISEGKTPENALSDIITRQVSEHKAKIKRETEDAALWGRDGKPIFENRSISQIHDELSELASKKIVKKRKLNYDERELALEAEYPCPDDDNPNHKWKFRLMKDTFDFTRTAKALSNCIGSSHYAESAIAKRATYLYMENELGEKVAAIELFPKGYDPEKKMNLYRAGQFQSKHDTSLPARYKDVALQWLDEHGIDYKNNDNVKAFGTNIAFYGDGHADFHNEEVDEATGRIVTISENKRLIENRRAQAAKVYGKTESGHINTPEVPDEIKNFDFRNMTLLDASDGEEKDMTLCD